MIPLIVDLFANAWHGHKHAYTHQHNGRTYANHMGLCKRWTSSDYVKWLCNNNDAWKMTIIY